MRSLTKPFTFQQKKVEEPDGNLSISLILSGRLDDFKELISRYPPLINSKESQHGNVPLHVAASRGDVQLVSFLLSHGADMNIRDIFGNSPLHYAIDKGKKAVAELLLTQGGNTNLQDNRGNSPLHIACSNNDVESVKLLLKFNADPDMGDLQDVKPREKTNSPLIRGLIDRRIHALHGGEQEEAKQTVQWMSFGVGLGVGLGVALAKYQQAMIEQQLNARLDNSRLRRKGNFNSVTSFRGLEEGSNAQQQGMQAMIMPGTAPTMQMPSGPSQSVMVPNSSSAMPSSQSQSFLADANTNSLVPSSQRKFL